MLKSTIFSCLSVNTVHRCIVTSSFIWLLSILAYHFIPPFQSFVEDVFIFTARPTTYYYAITPALEDRGSISGGLFTEVAPGQGVRPARSFMLKPTLTSQPALSSSSFLTERRVAITYADKCCLHAKSIMCKSAIANGFSECITYSRQSIDPTFAAQHADILTQKRGGGYWLWKPYVIFKTLLEMSDGDFLMYADAASYFVKNAEPLFKLAKELNKDIVVFQLSPLPGKVERKWTKRDTFVLLNCTDELRCLNSTQRLASWVLLRKSFNSVRFAAEYLTYSSDPRAITDAGSVLGSNDPDFIDHRHDQSVMSVLSKKWNVEPWPDPSQYGVNDVGPTPEITKEIAGKLIVHHRYKF